MVARLPATLLGLALLTSPAAAADCGAFAEKLEKAEALDRLNSKAFEARRTAESCRLMAEANAVRDEILKTTQHDCYTATRSKYAIKMSRETTAAVFKAMCGKP